MTITFGSIELPVLSYSFSLLLLGGASLFFSAYLFSKTIYKNSLDARVADMMFVVHVLYTRYYDYIHHKEKTKEILFFDKQKFFTQHSFGPNTLKMLGKKEKKNIRYLYTLLEEHIDQCIEGAPMPSSSYYLWFVFAMVFGFSGSALLIYVGFFV